MLSRVCCSVGRVVAGVGWLSCCAGLGCRCPARRFCSWRCIVVALVGFAGSRSLPSVSAPGGLVSRVVGSVVASGHPVAVGCCVGADAAVLSARLRLGFPSSSSGHQLVLFSVGGPASGGSFVSRLASLSGFWRGSALGHVRAAAALSVSPGHGCVAPVSVRWWAGGAASVPLGRRLPRRSRALVSELARSGGVLVAFVGPGRSVGTAGTVRAAWAAGVPVFVFPVGCSASVLPPVSGARWVRCSGSAGVWSRAFRLVAA